MVKCKRDIACFSKATEEKKRAVEDYTINTRVAEYDPKKVKDSLAKVFVRYVIILSQFLD